MVCVMKTYLLRMSDDEYERLIRDADRSGGSRNKYILSRVFSAKMDGKDQSGNLEEKIDRVLVGLG